MNDVAVSHAGLLWWQWYLADARTVSSFLSISHLSGVQDEQFTPVTLQSQEAMAGWHDFWSALQVYLMWMWVLLQRRALSPLNGPSNLPLVDTVKVLSFSFICAILTKNRANSTGNNSTERLFLPWQLYILWYVGGGDLCVTEGITRFGTICML